MHSIAILGIRSDILGSALIKEGDANFVSKFPYKGNSHSCRLSTESDWSCAALAFAKEILGPVRFSHRCRSPFKDGCQLFHEHRLQGS